MQYDPANYVKYYADTRKLPFTVAIDAQGEIAKAFGDVKLTPTSFLIDKEGHIIKRYLGNRSEEHTSELQSLMRISYAVFCLNKKHTRHYPHHPPMTPIHQHTP